MNILNEGAAQMQARLEGELRGKARTTLKNIVAACNEIETAHGVMNYSRVGAVATDRFGGPRAQSILNNKWAKNYISKRVEEYDAKSRSGRRRAKGGVQKPESRTTYPVDGLDAKTKLYIDILRQHQQRLEAENKYLSDLLEERTRKAPISIAEAISRGPTPTGAISPTLPPIRVPLALKRALQTLFRINTNDGTAESFAVRHRAKKHMLVCTDGGVESTLLSPSEWEEAVMWLRSAGAGE